MSSVTLKTLIHGGASVAIYVDDRTGKFLATVKEATYYAPTLEEIEQRVKRALAAARAKVAVKAIHLVYEGPELSLRPATLTGMHAAHHTLLGRYSDPAGGAIQLGRYSGSHGVFLRPDADRETLRKLWLARYAANEAWDLAHEAAGLDALKIVKADLARLIKLEGDPNAGS